MLILIGSVFVPRTRPPLRCRSRFVAVLSFPHCPPCAPQSLRFLRCLGVRKAIAVFKFYVIGFFYKKINKKKSKLAFIRCRFTFVTLFTSCAHYARFRFAFFFFLFFFFVNFYIMVQFSPLFTCNPAVYRYYILASNQQQLVIFGQQLSQELQSMPVSPQLANYRYMCLRLLRFSRKVYIARYLK